MCVLMPGVVLLVECCVLYVDHYGKFIKGIGVFNLTEEDDITRFDWFEEIKAPRALLIFIKPFILIAVYVSLRKFARGFVRT